MKQKASYNGAALKSALLSAISLVALGATAQTLPAPVVNTDYHYNGAPPANKVTLGKNLFWDKLLSGTNDISCGTCHNPQFGSGDSVSLGLGTGGDGGGVVRVANLARNRIVRNALPLYNNGAKSATVFNNDGDIIQQSDGTFKTPAGILPNATIVDGLDNVLAAQGLFPLVAPREQTGIDPAIPIAKCALDGDLLCAWNLYVEKIRAVPEYVTLFRQVYPEITSAAGIKINHITNALSAYQTVAFRSDDSPFDDFLRGDTNAMSPKAIAGMNLFYGPAGCSSCHSGVFQTDRSFHAIAMPQIGPGRRDGVAGKDDGRFRNTLVATDRHKYKTPSLRNVVLTGPWSHAGAYTTLEGVIRHHLDPVNSLNSYNTAQVILPPIPLNTSVATIDFKEHNDLTARAARAASNELPAQTLTNDQVGQLIAFMHALTGKTAMDFKTKIPLTVLSKLPVAD